MNFLLVDFLLLDSFHFLHVKFLLLNFLHVNFLLVDSSHFLHVFFLLVDFFYFCWVIFSVNFLLVECFHMECFYFWICQTFFTSAGGFGSSMRVLLMPPRVYVQNVGYKKTKWAPWL